MFPSPNPSDGTTIVSCKNLARLCEYDEKDDVSKSLESATQTKKRFRVLSKEEKRKLECEIQQLESVTPSPRFNSVQTARLLTAKLKDLESAYQVTKDLWSNAQKTQFQMQTELKSKDEKIHSLESALANADFQRQFLEKTILDVESELEKSVIKSDKSRKEQESMIEKLKQESQVKERKIEKVEQLLDSRLSNLAKLEIKLHQSHPSLKKQEEEITSLKSQLQRRISLKEEIRKEHANVSERLKEQQQLITMLQGKTSLLIREQTAYEESKITIASLNERIVELQLTIKEREDTMLKLNEQLHSQRLLISKIQNALTEFAKAT